MAKVNGSAEILDMGQARARLRTGDLKTSEFPTIGAYFSAVREAAGFSIEEIAKRTHIKAAYLNAIELMQFDDLPSRPFALGFVKTYAEALGVDAAAEQDPAGVHADSQVQRTLAVLRGERPGALAALFAQRQSATHGTFGVVLARSPGAESSAGRQVVQWI